MELERVNLTAEFQNVTSLFPGQTVFVRESPVVVLHAAVDATERTHSANAHGWHSGYVVVAGIDPLEANFRYYITAIERFLTGLRCAILNKIRAVTKPKS